MYVKWRCSKILQSWSNHEYEQGNTRTKWPHQLKHDIYSHLYNPIDLVWIIKPKQASSLTISLYFSRKVFLCFNVNFNLSKITFGSSWVRSIFFSKKIRVWILSFYVALHQSSFCNPFQSCSGFLPIALDLSMSWMINSLKSMGCIVTTAGNFQSLG